MTWKSHREACGLARRKHARTLKQSLRRIDYVMAKPGMTQHALGVTGYGLRHDFANDLHEKESGATTPLRGGTAVKPATDQAARLAVTLKSGHGRI
ncbi:MAG: hypothetical protein ACI8WM_001822 [Burkholderiaceae bacterium]|jgi:hypothetical protein